MQPDKQHGIHRTFENEVEHLDTLFKSEYQKLLKGLGQL